MKKYMLALGLSLLTVLGLFTGCSPKAETASGSDSLKIVATIFPEYDWVRQVLGDRAGEVQLTLLLDSGTDLHSYQPTAADMLTIGECDLFLYNRTPASVWGAHEEFFSCPRIDDLECAYTSLAAFIAAPAAGHVNVCAVFDNEEVGSLSKQGADSTLLGDVLNRALASLGLSDTQIRAALASSFMVSADNAHAVHPNHPEKYDELNRTFMNGGVVIKHNANQKYTTDAVSNAIFAEICAKAGVPVQHFANRSDVLGGSTLGNLANAHVSMNTVDIGLAQLAMHSSYETAGCADVDYMIRALAAFYQTNIASFGDGEYQLG